ncbi:MAG: 4Fe-4S dicluster domain-containing protein [Desulfobacteraceae bacterium]|nr:4Fe-4S dicluster domain-containing protein [Desulfobacteraceae bacterium]MBC2756879.1 4Fe-4S dicluster domain-containing protein [Desulfobacteraceae bacterium]
MKGNSTASSHQPQTLIDGKPVSRREFISRLALGGGALVLLSGCSRWALPGSGAKDREKIYEFIAVDYSKCTGCRTCEAVCASANNPVSVDGRMMPGPGNPALSNIYVHSFNPDVSAPAVCASCADIPCVNACPVDPDPATGRRALFREAKWGGITNDPERCISCGSCVDACGADSVGILAQHPETGRPMRMCTLCDGDPECVRHCPYDALSMIRVTADHPYYRMSPEEIAEKLSNRWYDLSV